MSSMIKQLNPNPDAYDRQALMQYDDGTFHRINRQGIVMGRIAVRRFVVDELIQRGALVQVACQWPSRNAIWRPA